MKDPLDRQRQSFIANLLTGYGLISLALLILTGPDLYHHTKDFVWGFLSSRYAPGLVPIAFAAFYAVLYPAMFFVMKAGWQTPAGLAVLWLADKIF